MLKCIELIGGLCLAMLLGSRGIVQSGLGGGMGGGRGGGGRMGGSPGRRPLRSGELLPRHAAAASGGPNASLRTVPDQRALL